MKKRIAALVLFALAAAAVVADTLPVNGPAGVYTVKTTGPTRITSGTGWVLFDWDTGQAVNPPVPPGPAPPPAPPAPAPGPVEPVVVHKGHFTVSYIEPKYPSPASGAVRDGLAATDWMPLDTTYRGYTDGAKQLTTLGFTGRYKASDLPMCFLQEDGAGGAAVIGTYKFPASADAVVKWVTEYRGK